MWSNCLPFLGLQQITKQTVAIHRAQHSQKQIGYCFQKKLQINVEKVIDKASETENTNGRWGRANKGKS